MDEGSRKTKSSIAFMVELFIMFAILLTVIVVVTTVSVGNRSRSLNAGYLTEAVICAESAAEMTSGAKDPEEALAMLEKMEQVESASLEGGTVTAEVRFRGSEGKEELFRMTLEVSVEKGTEGVFVEKEIEVCRPDGTSVYTLECGNYVKEGD